MSNFTLKDLLSDPTVAAALSGDAPVVVWTADGRRVLFAHPAAGGLGKADAQGVSAFADQIRTLSATMAPGAAPRLQRFRLPGLLSAPLVTCQVARHRLAGGIDIVVATVIGGAVGKADDTARARAMLPALDDDDVVFSGALVPLASRSADLTRIGTGRLDPATADTFRRTGVALIETDAGWFQVSRIGTGAAALGIGRPVPAPAPVSVAPVAVPPLPDEPVDLADILAAASADSLLAASDEAGPGPTDERLPEPDALVVEPAPDPGLMVALASGLQPVEAFDDLSADAPADADAIPFDLQQATDDPIPMGARETGGGPAPEAPELSVSIAQTDVPAVPLDVPPLPDLMDGSIAAQAPDTAARPDSAAAPEPPDAPAEAVTVTARQQALRFIWRTDAAGRLTDLSDDVLTLAGRPLADAIGADFAELADRLKLDPQGRLRGLLAGRNTWSGVSLNLPVEGSSEPLVADLSGLPAFGRDRGFEGYRGFGICRDLARLTEIDRLRATPTPRASTPAVEPPPVTDAAPGAPVEPAPPPPPAQPETVAVDTPAPRTDAADEEPVRVSPPRPALTVVSNPPNVVPLRTAQSTPDTRRPTLSPVDRSTFDEIARMLGARVEAQTTEGRAEPDRHPVVSAPPDAMREETQVEARDEAPDEDEAPGEVHTRESGDTPPVLPNTEAGREPARLDPAEPAVGTRMTAAAPDIIGLPSAFAGRIADEAIPVRSPENPVTAPPAALGLLDRLPVGVLVHRGETLLHANRTLLDWSGFTDLRALDHAGGLSALIGEADTDAGGARRLILTSTSGEPVAVDARLTATPWDDGTALALILTRRAAEAPVASTDDIAPVAAEADADMRRRADAAETAARETASILDIATDGVVVVDAGATILSANRSAQALFGHDADELIGRTLYDLIAPESHRLAADYIEGLTSNGVQSLLNDGREVIGRVRGGGTIPLFLNMGRIDGATDKLCAVLRDITPWKEAERDLTAAKAQAEKTSSAKSDFLAKISHEIRTPLNAIIGFSEVMMEERFGPVANDRYRDYLKDIHTSGTHVISLVNDLLDLSKIEAGKLELTFTSVHLNDLVQQCVAIMQPQANRGRIIIRPALAPTLPPVVADARSIRQIVLNLLSNSIKFTPAGGQVIVTTALTEQGEIALRVRDTGIGMDEKDIATAMEPFRQLSTTGRGGGTGLGLPLTKALAEANRAAFAIKSAPNAGTLVEVLFPVTRVLAE